MIDNAALYYKVESTAAYFEGEWTAEEIDAGLAGEPTVTTHVDWYENTPEGPVLITDPVVIAEREARNG